MSNEQLKATTVSELFDMITADNIESIMFYLYKTAHCLVDLKKLHPDEKIKMDAWEFIDDGQHNITLNVTEAMPVKTISDNAIFMQAVRLFPLGEVGNPEDREIWIKGFKSCLEQLNGK
ncbi:hypothetical protein AY601_4099 [Pedobacter cryoconitis]|uniref:Uncharacterized protein n=1 Tax=Pedobacter cryoconitis TaxID=188932 RepID=A0A127VI39_9SPHI|nr:hypothetical protein [Pedobacter cryoconitis]AMQ00950.1 hypothetical protein AY601_4099 [Pedobacter cryoconitis]